MNKKNIALFDFDGTITFKDSLLSFIRFVVGDIRFALGIIALMPFLIAYKIKILPNYKAKELMLSYFFKGYSEVFFKKIAFEYSLLQLDNLVRYDALNRLLWHKQKGHKIVIVSASIEFWLEPWCKKYDFELIGTKLEIKNGFITGKLLGNNCYGMEKVNRIKQIYDLNKFQYIYAYGDSNGDKEMLELADESYFKFFT